MILFGKCVLFLSLCVCLSVYFQDAMVLWMISLLLSAVLLFRLVNKVSKGNALHLLLWSLLPDVVAV